MRQSIDKGNDDWEDGIPEPDYAALDRVVAQKDIKAFSALSFEDRVYCLYTAFETRQGKTVSIQFEDDVWLVPSENEVVRIRRDQLNEKFKKICLITGSKKTT
jgi:hypothetical protein